MRAFHRHLVAENGREGRPILSVLARRALLLTDEENDKALRESCHSWMLNRRAVSTLSSVTRSAARPRLSLVFSPSRFR